MAEMTFGERVTALRKDRGMTITELADKAGIHRVSLHKLETDAYDPSLETVKKLARALGVDLNTFDDREKTSEKTV
jgi:transcriptional regulator with XRE-family HTH domain